FGLSCGAALPPSYTNSLVAGRRVEGRAGRTPACRRPTQAREILELRRPALLRYLSGECGAGSITVECISSRRPVLALRNSCQPGSFATAARTAARVLRSG